MSVYWFLNKDLSTLMVVGSSNLFAIGSIEGPMNNALSINIQMG
jgi:hypothetical protein